MIILLISVAVLSGTAVLLALSARMRLRAISLDDESGLSTLEWILIVSAVVGLATVGVILVRTSLGDEERVAEGTDSPAVRAARESVVDIDDETECAGSTAGGHLDVTTRWNAETGTCEVIRGANTDAVSQANKEARKRIGADVLEGINLAALSRSASQGRGCVPLEEAEGYFPFGGLKMPATFTLEPLNTGCTFDSGNPYHGFVPSGDSIVSVVTCAVESGNRVCAEVPGSSSPGQLNDRGCATASPPPPDCTAATSTEGQTASQRNAAGFDADILLAEVDSFSPSTPAGGNWLRVICSTTDDGYDDCSESTAVPSSGLYQVEIKITLSKAGETDKTYSVFDYVAVQKA